MRIVWLLNSILPQIAAARGMASDNPHGWTVMLADHLSALKDIELTVFYPQNQSRENLTGRAGNMSYVGFYENAIPELFYDSSMEENFRNLINKCDPDIVHIWGSEYVHTLCMLRAFGHPEKTVISIQGLIRFCGEKYTEGLPDSIINGHTIRDLLRHDSIYEQKQKFLKRGEYELTALEESKNVIGRTKWDEMTVRSVNPKLEYFHCGEILRREFYDGDRWSPDNCEKHSIFISQSSYPIKGIHFALQTLRLLAESYPDVRLYVAGKPVFPRSLRDHLKRDSYSKYICSLIKEYGLTDRVVFTGRLDAKKMKERYLHSNVYLQASIMENSPNSLGEAMILGMPCVASNVGGTASMLRDGVDGYLYPFDKPEEAARYIGRVYNGEEELEAMCGSAAEYAGLLYDSERAYGEYMKVYEKLNTTGSNE